MEIDDLLWESSKTRDKAISFFDSEKSDPNIYDSVITFSDLKDEYILNSSNNFFATPNTIPSSNIVIKKQNTFIRDETDEVLKSDPIISKFINLDAQSTIKKIIAHQEVNFSNFSDIPSKLLLLDKALKTFEENCIIKIIIFVKDTLKPSEFNSELLKRPFACRLYISYLKQMNYTDKLFEFYGLINKPEEAAILRFKKTLMQERTQLAKIENIKKCLSSYFQPNFLLYFEASSLQNYSKLLQLQIQIQNKDNDNSKKITGVFNRIPLKQPLFGRSLIGTLQYCCLYHYASPEGYFFSPQFLKKEFQLTTKHFQWQCLKSRCILSYWHEIEKIFITKNFFGLTQLKSAMDFEKVVVLLYRHNVPKEILSKYCDLVEDVDRRIELAKMCQCYECLLLAYKQTRNKIDFDRLKASLKPNDSAYKLALDISNDLTIKWRT